MGPSINLVYHRTFNPTPRKRIGGSSPPGPTKGMVTQVGRDGTFNPNDLGSRPSRATKFSIIDFISNTQLSWDGNSTGRVGPLKPTDAGSKPARPTKQWKVVRLS